MKATEGGMAPSVAEQRLKKYLSGRKREEGVVSRIQGAADWGRWWGNDCPQRAPGWEMNMEGKCWELSRARSAETDSWKYR